MILAPHRWCSVWWRTLNSVHLATIRSRRRVSRSKRRAAEIFAEMFAEDASRATHADAPQSQDGCGTERGGLPGRGRRGGVARRRRRRAMVLAEARDARRGGHAPSAPPLPSPRLPSLLLLQRVVRAPPVSRRASSTLPTSRALHSPRRASMASTHGRSASWPTTSARYYASSSIPSLG